MNSDELIANNHKYFGKINFWLIIILKLIIILLLFYIFEKYIVYNAIYYLLALIYKVFNLNQYYFIPLKFESILIFIYLHILLARIVILSIVFIQGGIFKKLLVHDQYSSFITTICQYAEYAIENLKKNNIIDFDYFMNKFNILKKSFENNKLKKINLDFPELNFENELNDLLDKYNNYKIKNTEENKKNLNESLKIFSNIIDKKPKFSILEQFLKFHYNESLMLIEDYMINSFDTHFGQKINISKGFDIYVLTPKYESSNKKTLAIYCNQNAICCEFYSISKDNIYYYLHELNCTIILWNYKGFGLRKGFTTFGSVDKDVNIFANYIKNNYNDYKIIINGCSIGGYSSIKLTQKLLKYNDNVVLICDRTFSDIKDIVRSLSFHKILIVIYNIIFHKFYFKYRNIDNYIALPYDKKIILFDEKDEIIQYNPSSLVFNITKKYFDDVIKPKLIKYNKYYSIIKNADKLSEKINLLSLESNNENFDDNGKFFIQHLNNNINSLETFFMFFIIFGFPFNYYKEISPILDKLKSDYTKIPLIFKKFIEKNKNEIDKEISEVILSYNFLYIKLNLICDLSDDDIYNLKFEDKNIFSINENQILELKKYFGCVHRILCGHNGKLKQSDFNFIKEFLKLNKYI